MVHKWMLTLLLAAPLAVGLAGCGKTKTAEADKSPAKTGPGPGPAPGELPGPAGGTTVSTNVALPTATKKIDTQYISDEFIAALVLHPAQALDSKLGKGILAAAEKEVGKKKVADAFAMVKAETGVDPRKIEQVIVLIDHRTISQLPMLFRGGSRPSRNAEPPRSFPPSKDRSFPSSKDRSSLDRERSEEADGGCLPQAFPPGKDGPPRGGMDAPPLPSVIVRFSEAVDRNQILSNLADKFLRGPDLEVPKKAKSGGPAFPGSKSDVKKPNSPPPSSDPKQKSDPPKASPPKEKEESGCLPDDSKAAPKLPSKTHDGKSYQLVGPLAVCFIDDKTLLAGPESSLKKMISAKNVQSPLIGRLNTLGAEHDLVLAVDAKPLREFLKDMPPEAFGPENAEAVGYAKKIQTLAITGSISGNVLASIVVQMPTEDDAKGLTSLIHKQGITKLREFYAQGKMQSKKGMPKEAEFLITLADQMMAGLAVGSVKTDVIISIARPAEMDNLPSRFGPAFKAAGKAAQNASRKNDLKNIGLALHNYHAAHNHFPAADSNGYSKERGRKVGLSWRVHLLPFLDQKALYDQFKLDEAWDSPHNKALIAKMPALFANPKAGLPAKDGKTALHVFVGKNNTPFSIDGGGYVRGGRLRDIVDGSSNTIAVVEAGSDKADIWTKPGGLPFDPAKNPMEALGNIPDAGFLVLLCDGSVHTVAKSRSASDLKALIQHNDGNYVPISGRASGDTERGATDRRASGATRKPAR